MSAKDIPGWNSDITPWQEWIAPYIPKGGTYLEVGVFLGASLARMGELRPDINLIAVDPWKNGWGSESEFGPLIEEHGGLYPAFLYMMRAHAPGVMRRTQIVRGSAKTIDHHLFPTPVDMLFIDGAHDRENVFQDLATFVPMVKRSGIIAGHDYSPDYLDVKAAVDETFGFEPNVGIPESREWSSVWWVVEDCRHVVRSRCDLIPS